MIMMSESEFDVVGNDSVFKAFILLLAWVLASFVPPQFVVFG